MKEILPIYIGCVLLAYLSHRSSLYDYRLARYKHKDRFFFSLIVFIAVIFVGLRTDYNDTAAYIRYYSAIETSTGWFSKIDWSVSEYPLFRILNNVLKIAGFSPVFYTYLFCFFHRRVSLVYTQVYRRLNTIHISFLHHGLLYFHNGGHKAVYCDSLLSPWD